MDYMYVGERQERMLRSMAGWTPPDPVLAGELFHAWKTKLIKCGEREGVFVNIALSAFVQLRGSFPPPEEAEKMLCNVFLQ